MGFGEWLTRARRPLGSVMLIAVGATLLLLALTAIWVDRTLYDTDGFREHAVEAVKDDDVQAVVVRQLVDQIIEAAPELVQFRPALEVVVAGVMDSQAFRSLFEAAVEDAHRSFIVGDQEFIVLTLVDVMIVISALAETEAPDLASEFPADLKSGLIELRRELDELGPLGAVIQALETARFLVWLLPALSLAAFGLAVWLAPSRRGATIGIGFACVLAAAGAIVGLEIGRSTWVDLADDPANSRALGAIWDVFSRNLRIWSFAVGAFGIAVAAAASSALEPVDVRSHLERLWRVVTYMPKTWWGHLARVGLFVLVGWFAVTRPSQLIEAIVVAMGLYALYYGLRELIRITGLARPPEPAVSAEPAAAGERLLPALDVRSVAVVAVVAIALGGIVFAVQDFDRFGGGGGEPTVIVACNGRAELCDRPLNEVAFATTHNSMSAASEPGFFNAAHFTGIRDQLESGIRGFQIDSYYGFPTESGLVRTDLPQEKRDAQIQEFGEDVVAAADRVSASLLGRETGERSVYLCHAYCEWGATGLVDALTDYRKFLDDNPAEVIIIIIEDYITPEDTAAAFEESGLVKYVYTYRSGARWPTLREMIEREERVLVMAEHDGSGPAWYHQGFELMQETPFGARSPEKLSCEPNRGLPDSPLFQLNHFVSPPTPPVAEIVNEFDFFLQQALKCQEERGLIPNVVAVNFYEIGDVLAVVDALNGIESAAQER